MPPLSSPGCGPRRRHARPVKVATDLRCTHPERGMPRPGHADGVGGYRGGPTPESLVRFLAKGQQPTDLSTSERLCPSEFGCRQLTDHDPRVGRRGREAGTVGLRRGWSALWPLSRRSKTTQGRNTGDHHEGDDLDGRALGSRGRMDTL